MVIIVFLKMYMEFQVCLVKVSYMVSEKCILKLDVAKW